MTQTKHTFRNQLLAMESMNPTLREHYEREVKAMIEKQLTWYARVAHTGGLCLGLFFLIAFGRIAIILPGGLLETQRLLWSLGAIAGLAIISVEASILKKGAVNLKIDGFVMAWIPWAAIVVFGSISMALGVISTDALVHLLFFFVMASTFMIQAIVERSEVKTREKLLEIEYQIAELTEKLESNTSTND